MSRIDELIRELCPDGIPYLPIGHPSVSVNVVAGATPKKDVDSYWRNGTIPWMSSGEVNRGTVLSTDQLITQSAYDATSTKLVPPGSVVVALAGQGKTRGMAARIRIQLCTNQSLAAIVLAPGMTTDFLYHVLRANYRELRSVSAGDGGRGGLNLKLIRDFNVPVPPTEVQREISRLLDSFEELEAELEAELNAELDKRTLQYAYYRDQLLSFTGRADVVRAPLGDIGAIFGGLTGKSKQDFADGNAHFVSYVSVYNNIEVDVTPSTFVRVGSDERQRALERGDVIFTGSSEGPSDVAMSSVVVAEVPEPLYLNSFCIGFRPRSEALDPDFSKHLFRSGPMRRQLVGTAAGVTRFNVSKARLAKVMTPVPQLSEQREIARQLDHFYDLSGDLFSGLPAERAARRQQYEHYRAHLLTFDELRT